LAQFRSSEGNEDGTIRLVTLAATPECALSLSCMR
jgi:hypothetical protein